MSSLPQSVLDIQEDFNKVFLLSKRIKEIESELQRLRDQRADIFISLRDRNQTWVDIASYSNLETKRVTEITNKRIAKLSTKVVPNAEDLQAALEKYTADLKAGQERNSQPPPVEPLEK